MTQTPYRCTVCQGRIIRVREDEDLPPYQPYEYLVCSSCGVRHDVDGGRIGRLDGTGRVVDVSDEKTRQWQSRGGCRGVCGRAFPWEIE